MTGLNLTEEQLDEFLKNGSLYDSVVVPVTCLKISREHGAPLNLNAKETQVFMRVSSDLAQIKSLIDNLPGNPPAQCPSLGEEATGTMGYTFTRFEYIGRHVISIERPEKDRFYCSLGVSEAPNGITGYYLMGTNGNINDVIEALENTKQFFPIRVRSSERLKIKRLRAT